MGNYKKLVSVLKVHLRPSRNVALGIERMDIIGILGKITLVGWPKLWFICEVGPLFKNGYIYFIYFTINIYRRTFGPYGKVLSNCLRFPLSTTITFLAISFLLWTQIFLLEFGPSIKEEKRVSFLAYFISL